MNARDRPSDTSENDLADVLLPWLVNGTLDAGERAFVERHVDACAQCRREVDWLRSLRAACVAAESSPAAAHAARRLRSHLDASRPRARAPWRLPAVAAFAAAATFGVALLAVDDEPLYRTLGAPGASTAHAGSLVVVFDPSTSEFDLRRVLRAAGARIVDGPTQTNAYVLDVAAAHRGEALKLLRAEHAVVLAERLDGGATR
jgi:hypothetical protein